MCIGEKRGTLHFFDTFLLYNFSMKTTPKYSLLYVEDEALIRKIAVSFLEDLFYEIYEAEDGEEALAVALYCALVFPGDWERAVLAAVNHSGDSDSTGCMTGAVLGTKLGCDSLPQSWVDQLESSSGIRALAGDLFRVVREGADLVSGGNSPSA